MTRDKTEAAITISAALFFLFSAMLQPLVSVVVAATALVALGVYHFFRK